MPFSVSMSHVISGTYLYFKKICLFEIAVHPDALYFIWQPYNWAGQQSVFTPASQCRARAWKPGCFLPKVGIFPLGPTPSAAELEIGEFHQSSLSLFFFGGGGRGYLFTYLYYFTPVLCFFKSSC